VHSEKEEIDLSREGRNEMKKTPLTKVNDEFGGKEKLVDAIVAVLERGDEDKDALRRRLLAASNTKLLRLHGVAAAVKEHGGKAKLIESILKLSNRSKDEGYKARLSAYTPARLLDIYGTMDRAQKRGSPTPAGKSAKRKGKAA
jgi:hypothetical protein